MGRSSDGPHLNAQKKYFLNVLIKSPSNAPVCEAALSLRQKSSRPFNSDVPLSVSSENENLSETGETAVSIPADDGVRTSKGKQKTKKKTKRGVRGVSGAGSFSHLLF